MAVKTVIDLHLQIFWKTSSLAEKEEVLSGLIDACHGGVWKDEKFIEQLRARFIHASGNVVELAKLHAEIINKCGQIRAFGEL